VRKPVGPGIMRSASVSAASDLGYSKMHTGVVRARHMARRSSPTGNGTIEKAGVEGGYGK